MKQRKKMETMEKNYYEVELGKVADTVKNCEFKGSVIDANDSKEKKIADILSGNHDNDFIDKEKFSTICRCVAYAKASKIINWNEISLALNDSITVNAIPKQHIKKIDELRKLIAKWILENDTQFNANL